MNVQKRRGTKQLHLPVIAMLGLWVLFLLSLGLAWHRVSQSEGFSGTPFRSFELEDPRLNRP